MHNDATPLVRHQKHTGQISDAASGMLKARHPQAGVKQYRRQAARVNGQHLWSTVLNSPVIAKAIIEEPRKRFALLAGQHLWMLHQQPRRIATAIQPGSGTGLWPVSGASYVSAMPKLAGPRSCYRIRGDFFEDFLTNQSLWKVLLKRQQTPKTRPRRAGLIKVAGRVYHINGAAV